MLNLVSSENTCFLKLAKTELIGSVSFCCREAKGGFSTRHGVDQCGHYSDLILPLSAIIAWKVSLFGVFLVRIFLHLSWIWRESVSLRIQSEYGKIQTRKTSNTDTFQAANILEICCSIYEIFCGPLIVPGIMIAFECFYPKHIYILVLVGFSGNSFIFPDLCDNS